MRIIRPAAAWAAVFALLAGVWLPAGAASRVADADGFCGPVLTLEHSVEHFEVPPSPSSDAHCVFCHWLSMLSSASASLPVSVVPPSVASRAHGARPVFAPSAATQDDGVPRAPPSGR
jgi:hypothetical protein